MDLPNILLEKLNISYEIYNNVCECFPRLIGFDKQSFIKYYIDLMRIYRFFQNMEYIRVYTLLYIANILSEYMHSSWTNYDEAKRYGQELINRIMGYAERGYIEIEDVKKTIIDVCNDIRDLINTDELLSFIDPESNPGIKWAKQNVIKRKCKGCGQEFISITDEALIYLLIKHYILIPKKWVEYCPKCVRRRELSRYIRMSHRRFRRSSYEKLDAKQKEGKEIYSSLYEKFYDIVKNYSRSYIYNLIDVLEISERKETNIIKELVMDIIRFYGKPISIKKFYKYKHLFKELSYRGPLTIDELAKILAEKLDIKETSSKRWIKELLNRDLSQEVLVVTEKHGKTIEVDISPLAILDQILFLLFIIKYRSLGLPDISDIYFYLQRHNKNHFIPIINTLFELRYDTEHRIHFSEYMKYRKHYAKIYLENKNMDLNVFRWRIFEDMIFKVLIDLINDAFGLKYGIKFSNKFKLDLKYLALKLNLAYKQAKEDRSFLDKLDKVVKHVYDIIVHHYNSLQELKKEFKALLSSRNIANNEAIGAKTGQYRESIKI